MNEPESRILDQAKTLIFKLGVRSVTMDDIARELGMSKKTIYQFYQNKAEIVYEVARAHFRTEKAQSEAISREAANAIDEEFRILMWSLHVFQTMAPNLVEEIRKYYPQTWQIFEQFQNEYIMRKVRDNLDRGIAEGLYRAEIDREVIAQLRLAQVEWFLGLHRPGADQFSPIRVQIQLFDLYMNGICTEKGQGLLREYLTRIRKQASNLQGLHDFSLTQDTGNHDQQAKE
jgi:AcrR family transcriptional regulator